MIVDGHWVMLGSANWDARSLRLNFELNVECYSRGFADEMEHVIAGKISAAREVSLARGGRPLGPGKIARRRRPVIFTLFMKTFDSLTEREVLALAISLEEEDARIYEDFADGLQENYPEQAAKFREMRREEDGHRHRLLELYKARFGEHVPHIRRQDVRGFVDRKPVWLVRPLGLKTVQKTAETMEVETRRFYEAACRRTNDAGIRQLLGDLG